MPPTPPAPSLSPAPTVSLTARRPCRPRPRHRAHALALRAPPADRRRATLLQSRRHFRCWGNSRRFLRARAPPFDTLSWPDDLNGITPLLGTLTTTGPGHGCWRVGRQVILLSERARRRDPNSYVEGRKSPFDGIDVGRHGASVFAEFGRRPHLIVGRIRSYLLFQHRGSAARAEFTPRSDGTGTSMFSDYTP